jgi:ATP-dependent exoDNAse (exonuclease V) alpha subunit
MDGGRAIELDPTQQFYLDHGYAVTSHSSQGQTADRVQVHVDTELGALAGSGQRGLIRRR